MALKNVIIFPRDYIIIIRKLDNDYQQSMTL